MIRHLARLFRTGLLPLLLAAGLLGGLTAEAVACAGEPVIEHQLVADGTGPDMGDDGTTADADTCEHGHSHHGYALPAQYKDDPAGSDRSAASPLTTTMLSSAPPGGLERPPRI